MKKKTIIIIAAALGFALFLLFVALVLGGIFSLYKFISSSDVVEMVIRDLEKSEVVVAEIGRPIKLTILGGTISIKTSGAIGKAEMDSKFTGPRGKIRVVVLARKGKGEWDYEYFAIYPKGEKVVLIGKGNDE